MGRIKRPDPNQEEIILEKNYHVPNKVPNNVWISGLLIEWKLVDKRYALKWRIIVIKKFLGINQTS